MNTRPRSSTAERFGRWLGRGWRGYGDFSVVSDEDYLSDLNRSLEINQATHLQRKGGVTYRSDKQYFDAYLNDYQTISESIANEDKPYAQLPEIIYAGQAGAGILEANLESQYTVFYRDNEGLTGPVSYTHLTLPTTPYV